MGLEWNISYVCKIVSIDLQADAFERLVST